MLKLRSQAYTPLYSEQLVSGDFDLPVINFTELLP